MKSFSRAVRAFLLTATVAVALVGCGAKAASDPPPAQAQGGNGAAPPAAGQLRTAGRAFATIPVLSVAVHIGPLTAVNSTAGTIEPVTQSSVASQVAGVALRVVHQAGDWVKAGETVVQVDDSQLKLSVQVAQVALQNARISYDIGQYNSAQSDPKLQLQVQSAQSSLASAQKNYDSQKALFSIGGISSSQLDQANSQLQQAQANVEAAKTALDQNAKSGTQNLAQLKLAIDQSQVQLQIAQLNLQNASIKAPFAGQIAAVQVNPGTYVSLNTPVFILVSSDKEISFNVSPSDAPNLPVNAPVTFTYLGKDYTVRISQAPAAPLNGVVPMVASVPRSVPLPYGGVGTVSYSLTLARGALLPIAALQVNEDQNFVYEIVNGKATVKPLTILAESGTSAAVAGVEDGAMVILNPPAGLLAGSSVQPVSQPGASPAGTGPSTGKPPTAATPLTESPPATGQGGKK